MRFSKSRLSHASEEVCYHTYYALQATTPRLVCGLTRGTMVSSWLSNLDPCSILSSRAGRLQRFSHGRQEKMCIHGAQKRQGTHGGRRKGRKKTMQDLTYAPYRQTVNYALGASLEMVNSRGYQPRCCDRSSCR